MTEFCPAKQNPPAATNLAGGQKVPLEEFTHKTVHAVAGIGNPERFFHQLERLEIKLVRHPFPDHHQFSPGDLEFDGDLPILMTEKDGIKCRQFGNANCWSVGAQARVDSVLLDRIQSILK